ncbi:MAG: hypothetical protein FJX76_25370 [Armatimonadetes bacterium]|nr:hypothetical protein [Armatimonadota bacterium]
MFRFIRRFIVILGLVALIALDAACQITPPAILGDLEDDALWKARLRVQRPLDQGALEKFAGRTVSVGDGETVRLDAVARGVFAEQRRLGDGVRSLPPGVISGPPAVVEMACELPTAFLLSRGVRLTVVEPAALKAASPEFASFLGNGAARASVRDLSPEGQAGLRRFLSEEAPRLPAGDPLREAAARGEEALLQAISEGKGTFEVVDTVLVPRAPLTSRDGRIALPVVRDGVLDLEQVQAVRMRPLTEMLLGSLDLPPAQEAVLETGGHYDYRAAFLAGFTRANAWEWERRWRYPSGFFRATLGGGYAVGLRIPIEVSGRLSPTRVAVEDARDAASSVHNQVRARALDANAAFYAASGLPEDLRLQGREAVLEARVGFGYKFRVFWEDVAQMRYRDFGFDYSQDVAPPFAGQGGLRIAIPPELSRTEVELSVIRGWAQAGLFLGGDGEVRVDHEGLVDSEVVDRRTLRFRNGAVQDLGIALPALPESGTHRYGFRLSNPSYHLDLTLTPEVRLGLRVGVDGFSRSFRTDWISLGAARVRLGTVSFNRHRGTHAQFAWQGGRKQFTALSGPVSYREIRGAVRMRSGHTGRWVVADRTPDAIMKAAGTRAEADVFDIRPLDDGRVALRCRRTEKFVRAGLGEACWLGACSERVDRWETFELIPMAGNRFAVRAVYNDRLVRAGIGRDSILGATSARRDVWEVFEYEPVE